MAKLQAPQKAGFNADKVPAYKMVRIDKIIIDPEISGIFKIDEKILAEITEDIKQNGYDKGQPITVWKDHDIIVDGHTRLAAAKAAGLTEIPVVEKEFADKEEVKLHTFERQTKRRNLPNEEILIAVQILMKDSKNPNGAGKQAKALAEKLGISTATVYQAKAVLNEGDEDTIQDVKEGNKSIKQAYNEIKSKNRPEPKQPSSTDNIKLNTSKLSFNADLRDIIKYLIEEDETMIAEKLIYRFLDEDGKELFLVSLPVAVRAELSLVYSVD